MDEIERLRKIIFTAENIVFFGGAGVSTESGIPDFRGAGGLYSDTDCDISAEEILSHSFFMRHPDRFYKFYNNNLLYPDAQPNDAHIALAKLEDDGILSAVITQNIDGLHQAAGSRNVLELHGSVRRGYCINCGKLYARDEQVAGSDGVPRCTCGSIIKPDVVLYGEGLDSGLLYSAEEYIENADVLIIGGTSLSVQPAASLVESFCGSHLVIINKTPTHYDNDASLVINDSIGRVLGEAVLL